MSRTHRMSSYATTIATAGDLVVVTYHATQIVAFDRLNVTLRTGGWDTVTTRRKMNQTARHFGLGFAVFRDAGESYVRRPDGSTVPLTDNMTFTREG